MSLLDVRLIHVPNPFKPHERKTSLISSGIPLSTIIPPSHTASINGRVVDLATAPKPGDTVAYCPTIRGGGGGGGKNVVMAVAAIALTVATFGTGGILATGFAAGSSSTWLAAGALLFLGGSLMGGMSPKVNVDTPNIAESSWENGHSWGQMKPLSTQGGCVPLTYGTYRVTGTVLNQHVSGDGKHQFLNLLLCGGEGPIDSISDLEINGNPSTNFALTDEDMTDLSVALTIGYSGGEVGFREATAEVAGTGLDIEVNFLNGLSSAVTITAEYKTGAGAWTAWVSESVGTIRADAFTKTWRKLGLTSGIYSVRVKLTDATETQLAQWTRLSVPSAGASLSIESTLGTNDQAALAHFTDTYADQFFSYELTTSAWTAYQTEGDGGKGLEIVVTLPKGLYRIDQSDGAQYETWVKFSAQYRKVGDVSWTDWLTEEEIRGKETTATRRVYRVDDLDEDQYEVQLQLTSTEGTGALYANLLMWSQLTHVIYDDFSRPGKVLVGIRALATDKLSGGMPSISWLQTRSTVLVYDPDAAAYVEKAATNPAWICYDLIHRAKVLHNVQTDADETVVFGEAHAKIDFAMFDAWADFCDEVPTGHTEARCVANIYLDAPGRLWEQLQKVAQIGRGMILMRGTSFSCAFDGQEDTPVQMFTVGNIGLDSFTGEFLSNRDRANAVEISFVNEDKDYQRDTVIAYTDGFDASTNVATPTQITLAGITDYQRAYREGLYRLRLNEYIRRTVSFHADIDALACQVGDVVRIQHDIPRWGIGGRLVAATASTLTLDKEVTLTPGKDYTVRVRLGDGTLVSKTALPPTTPDPIPVATPTGIAVITASDAASYDRFGSAIAFSADGTVMVVGAPDWEGPAGQCGGVYTFDLVDGEWAQRGDVLISPDAALNTRFGASVALNSDGTVLAVGSPNAFGIGAFYVFDAEYSSWTARGTRHIWGATNGLFGRSIALSGDGTRLFVGSPGDDNGRGFVAAYTISGTGWTLKSFYASSLKNSYLGTGLSCNSAGTVVFAGQPFTSTAGAVHLLAFDGTTISSTGVTVTPDDPGGTDLFGQSTATNAAGTILYVGAPYWDQTLTNQGAFYVFDLIGSTWTQRGAAVIAPDGDVAAGARFGEAVATVANGWQVAVGANYRSVGTKAEAGKVYTIKMADEQTADLHTCNVSPDFDVTPAKFDLYAIGELNVETKPFRINKIARSGDLSVRIDATEYYAAVYDESAAVPTIDYTIPLGTISGLVLGTHFDANGEAWLDISWQPARDSYGGANITIDGVAVGRVGMGRSSFSWKPAAAKTYSIIVEGLNLIGLQSGGTLTGSITIDVLSIPLVTGLTLDENTYILADGTVLTDVLATWTMPDFPYFGAAVVTFSIDGGSTYLLAGISTSTQFTIKALENVSTVIVKVALRSRGGTTGNAATSSTLTIVGKSWPPSNVANFQATQDGGMIDLRWDHISDPDRRGYEIREGGVSWNEGVPVGVDVTENSWSVPIQEERDYLFRIKAVDNSGVESATATETTITPIMLLPKNVILTYDEMALKDGTPTQTEWTDSGYTMDRMPGRADDPAYAGAQWSDFPAQVLALDEETPGAYYESGTYLSAVRDIGQPVTVQVIPKMLVDAPAGTSFRLKFRSSVDNITWSDWTDAVAQTVTARYLQGRVELATTDTSLTPKVRVWSWVVDVPDIDRAGAGVTVAVGGTTVPFGYTYYQAPSVQASAVGGSRRAEIISVSETGFVVVVKDDSNTDVGGTVGWQSRGY